MVFEKKEIVLLLSQLRGVKKEDSLKQLSLLVKKYTFPKTKEFRLRKDPFYALLFREKQELEMESVSYDISTPAMCYKYKALLDLMEQLGLKAIQK